MQIQAFESPRLLIRSYTAQDRGFCFSLWCDAENGKYMSDPSLAHVDDTYLAALDGMAAEETGCYLVAELKADRSPAATCCAFPGEDGNWDIGYCLHRSLWRQGYGTELLTAVLAWLKQNGAKTVTAEIADENAASRALAARLGFAPVRESSFKKWGEDTRFPARIYQLSL